jgi:hypothetical protein
MGLPRWIPGDELTIAQLNQLADAADAALSLTVDPSSGLSLQLMPAGNICIRWKRPLEIWVLITGGGTSGIYAGTQQLEEAGGTWANGPRVFTVVEATLVEANGNTAVPTGSTTIVRAYRDRSLWRFLYSAC